MSRISQRLLDDGNRWPELFEANHDLLSDPNRIVPGQVLKLPNGTETPKPRSQRPTVPPAPSVPPANTGTMANQGDWRAVRRAVNGGYNGWDTFIGAVNRLKAAVG